jgi:hypothetical protein
MQRADDIYSAVQNHLPWNFPCEARADNSSRDRAVKPSRFDLARPLGGPGGLKLSARVKLAGAVVDNGVLRLVDRAEASFADDGQAARAAATAFLPIGAGPLNTGNCIVIVALLQRTP